MKKSVFLFFIVLYYALLGSTAFSQGKSIVSGRILDQNTKEPLIGVNVVEIDENGRYISGTITDNNGNYILDVSSPQASILVSYIGYMPQTFDLSGRQKLDIALEENIIKMDEVVVTGEKMGNDGVIAIRDRATAVSRIELNELKSSATTTVEEMLQGRLGGVDITAVSGDPGAGLNIRIRGTATLNAQNDPLIVVNGIPYDTNLDDDFDFATADVERFGNLIDIAPEDIESIEVLKDAASTAQWGSRAANGVLMIKTKRGLKSPPVFEYTQKLTRAVEPPHIPMLDGAGYARLVKEAHFNVNAGVFQNKEIDFDPEWEMYHEFNQNTDWINEITRVAYTSQHNFSVRGGGEKTKYNMSLGYNDETGTTLGTGLKKITMRTSLDYDLSSRLRFTSDILFTRYDQTATFDWEDSDFNNKRLRSLAYQKMPNISIYERDTSGNALEDYFTPYETIQGNAKDKYNPLAFAELGEHKRYKDNTRALFNIRYRISEKITFDGSVTLDIFDEKIKKFLPYKAIGYNYDDDITNSAREEYSKKNAINTLSRLIYDPTLGYNHEMTVLLQVSTEESFNKWMGVKTSRSASPDLQEANGDVDLVSVWSGSSTYRYASAYSQVHYKFKDRYIFSGGFTLEGSSRFSKDSRFGLFPNVSVAWRISEEGFMQGLSFIDDFKLRASWGKSGNSPSDNYLYFNSYGASPAYGYLGVSGVRPEGVELTGLQWETIEQTNPGISFSAFRYRLNIEADYYTKITRDLYIKDFNIPTSSGFSKINQNNGEMMNRGWELMMDVVIFKRDNWSFSLNGNLSANENVVLKLPENISLTSGNMLDNGNWKTSIEPGNAMGGFFGYQFDGVYIDYDDLIALDKDGEQLYDVSGFPMYMIFGASTPYEFEPGDARYRDLNYDGVIDELDLVYLGDANPKLLGGFGPRFQYKNITVNAFFHLKLGHKIINQTKIDTEKMYNHDNQSKATNYRWRRVGDVTDMPRAVYQRGFNWLGSSRFVEDGSFLRLKTASISYNFPASFCERIRIKDLKIYTTTYNAFTWTKYSGQDPDVGMPSSPHKLPKDDSKTPPSRRVIIGLNLSF